MKKTVILIFFGFIALFWQSCTKSCTCENPNGKVKEVEISPSEKCSARSDSTWTCS